jgi:Arm DNA-binding domain
VEISYNACMDDVSERGQIDAYRLTDRAIRALRPRLKQYDCRDSEVRGLALRVNKTSKTWVYAGRINGRSTRRTLGEYPVMTLAQARAKALEWRAMLARGEDPTRNRDPDLSLKSATCCKFGDVCEQYFADMKRRLAEARETLRRTDPKLSGMPEPTCRADPNAEVQRRLRKLEDQCTTPKPRPPVPPTEAENAQRLKQMIDKVANAERQFILDVIAGALAEATEEVAEEAAEHAASLVKPLEQQMMELKTLFAQLLTNVAMMQATVIKERGAIQDLPELPKMKDVN